ncbi:MAG: beta-ketoacyl-ACP synthase [Acidobacteria bacterium]|nr:beta-ketoacyl-ACP synthase [Acidobacteriota bacterium]
MRPASLEALGLVCALGRGKAEVARGLFAGDTSGLVEEQGHLPEGRAARVGRVPGDLRPLPPAFAKDDSRATRILLTALEEIRDAVDMAVTRFGRARIGVVLGTSTSGIEAGERAIAHRRAEGTLPSWYDYQQQEIGRMAPFLADYLGLRGPALTVSTACTSGGKALASARRMLDQGWCDAVIAGGCDSLCKLTVNGFTSLESATPELCNPMSRNRGGINVGEGAALFLLSREPSEVTLLGAGASSDAHHISSPDPSGAGAAAAMREALADARLRPDQIGYLNLHATATPKNDAMESLATAEVFPDGVPCSGTKPLTGHALGAAAALEAAFAWLTLHPEWNPNGLLPPHRWDGAADPGLPALNLVRDGARLGPRAILSNAFAFGGNNLSLVIGSAP